jgi:hypothetical protein
MRLPAVNEHNNWELIHKFGEKLSLQSRIK